MSNIDTDLKEMYVDMPHASDELNSRTIMRVQKQYEQDQHAQELHTQELSEDTRRIYRMRKRMAVAAACIVLVLAGGIGVYAAGGLKPVSELFANMFHMSKQSKDLIDEMGQPVKRSATCDGVKVTLDAVIRNVNQCGFAFTVEREDGKALGNEKTYPADTWRFEQVYCKAEKSDEENFLSERTRARSYIENPDDTAIHYLYVISGDTEMSGKMTIRLEDLVNEKTMVAEGEWDFEITEEPTDSSVLFAKDKTINVEDMNLTIKELYVSPIGFSIRIAAADGEELDTEKVMDLVNNDMMIGLKNGKTKKIDMKLYPGDGAAQKVRGDDWEGWGGSGEISQEGIFDKIIDPDEIKAFYIKDVEITR